MPRPRKEARRPIVSKRVSEHPSETPFYQIMCAAAELHARPRTGKEPPIRTRNVINAVTDSRSKGAVPNSEQERHVGPRGPRAHEASLQHAQTKRKRVVFAVGEGIPDSRDPDLCAKESVLA